MRHGGRIRLIRFSCTPRGACVVDQVEKDPDYQRIGKDLDFGGKIVFKRDVAERYARCCARDKAGQVLPDCGTNPDLLVFPGNRIMDVIWPLASSIREK